ncbi:hypothetical protein HC891_02370 [Candidatus Gracilibacteria bacterium]|nr:hypothetical protein [Candidatus Gracilibacteria bacterium]
MRDAAAPSPARDQLRRERVAEHRQIAVLLSIAQKHTADTVASLGKVAFTLRL